LPFGGDVNSFLISADSARVVYIADQSTAGVDELFSRAIDGSGSPVQLNGTLVIGGDVFSALISADGTRVVYYADQNLNGRNELFGRAIDGSGTAVVLNDPLISSRRVLG